MQLWIGTSGFQYPEWKRGFYPATQVFGCLRDHRAAPCIAENAEVETPAIATTDVGYLRLRREDYASCEVARRAEFVRSQAGWREAFASFKHEETGVGPKFAPQFKK